MNRKKLTKNQYVRFNETDKETIVTYSTFIRIESVYCTDRIAELAQAFLFIEESDSSSYNVIKSENKIKLYTEEEVNILINENDILHSDSNQELYRIVRISPDFKFNPAMTHEYANEQIEDFNWVA